MAFKPMYPEKHSQWLEEAAEDEVLYFERLEYEENKSMVFRCAQTPDCQYRATFDPTHKDLVRNGFWRVELTNADEISLADFSANEEDMWDEPNNLDWICRSLAMWPRFYVSMESVWENINEGGDGAPESAMFWVE